MIEDILPFSAEGSLIIDPDTGLPWIPPEELEKMHRRREAPYGQPSLPLYAPEMPHQHDDDKDNGQVDYTIKF